MYVFNSYIDASSSFFPIVINNKENKNKTQTNKQTTTWVRTKTNDKTTENSGIKNHVYKVEVYISLIHTDFSDNMIWTFSYKGNAIRHIILKRFFKYFSMII